MAAARSDGPRNGNQDQESRIVFMTSYRIIATLKLESQTLDPPTAEHGGNWKDYGAGGATNTDTPLPPQYRP